MKSGVELKVDKSRQLEAALKALTSQEVLVGIPADKAQRQAAPELGEEGSVTNAQLGFIHENGSPAHNIPARPFLRPGIRKASGPIVEQLRAAGEAALSGNVGGVGGCLEKAGIIAQNSVRAQFVDGDLAPLAESTLNKRHGVVRGENGKILKRGKTRRESGAINPLILSGQLRKAVTYVVRKRSS
jgi:hypothetical protein